MPTTRIIFVAAAWTQRARGLYSIGSEDLRAGLNRDELRYIDDAIGIGIEIACSPENWATERARADHRAATLQALYRGGFATSDAHHDPLHWTVRSPERFDSTAWGTQATYRDMVAGLIRSDVAATAHYAVQAAANGSSPGTYGYPQAYDAAYGAHMSLQHLFNAAHSVRSLQTRNAAPTAQKAVDLALRDYLRTRDLMQDFRVPGFLSSATNIADDGRDWRLRCFGENAAIFESALKKLPRMAALGLALRSVEHVFQSETGPLSHGVPRDAVDSILRAARRGAETLAADDSHCYVPSHLTDMRMGHLTHVAISALAETCNAVRPHSAAADAKSWAARAVLSCVEYAFGQEDSDALGTLLRETVTLAENATRNRWNDSTRNLPNASDFGA